MERLLTVDQVCDVLQVTKDWIYDHVQTGDLICVRLSGRGSMRFRESDIEAFIESRVGK